MRVERALERMVLGGKFRMEFVLIGGGIVGAERGGG